MVKISNFWKIPNWNTPKTPSEMHMYDMVKIDTIVCVTTYIYWCIYSYFMHDNKIQFSVTTQSLRKIMEFSMFEFTRHTEKFAL